MDYTYSNYFAFAESHHNSRANISAFYLHTLLTADYLKEKSMKRLSRKKKILFSLVLYFLISCICFLIAEVAIRIVCPQSILPRFVENTPWGIRKVLPNVNAIHKTSEYSYRYRTNSQGFRGTKEYEIVPPENCLRIVVQGDSVTLGYGVKDNETYSYLLEEMLRKDGIEAEVINMAVSGFGTAEEIIQFHEVAKKYKPDLVILGFFQNDPLNNAVCGLFTVEEGALCRTEDDFIPGIYLRDRLYAIPGYSFFSQHSHLFTFFRQKASSIVIRRLRKKAEFHSTPVEKRERPDEGNATNRSAILTKLLLERYTNDVTQTGAKLLVVDIVDKRLKSRFPIDLKHNARSRIVSTYDALKRSLDEGRKSFYESDSHPTAEGHRTIATCIYETLQDEWVGRTLPRNGKSLLSDSGNQTTKERRP